MDQGVLHSRSAQPIVATTALNWPVFVLTPPCHLFDEQPTSVNLPESWSQLIRDRVIDEDEEKLSMKQMEIKKQLLHQHTYGICGAEIKVKQENTLSLDLQSSKKWNRKHPNSVKFESHTKDIGTVKKPKVEANTPGHGAFKVRKEKLGDRITALHQLVSPFGKTDTASVLLEAIGYIKLLQSQIQVLSLPYMDNRRVKISSSHQVEEFAGDLRSRGLCLVPVSGSLVSVAEVHGSDYHFH